MMQKSKLQNTEVSQEILSLLVRLSQEQMSKFANSAMNNTLNEALSNSKRDNIKTLVFIADKYMSHPEDVNDVFEAVTGYSLNTILESTAVELNLIK